MPKFSIEEHEKKMRELLKPKPASGVEFLTKFRDIANKSKAGPVVPPVTKQEV